MFREVIGEDCTLEQVSHIYYTNRKIMSCLNLILNSIINEEHDSKLKKKLMKSRSSLLCFWDFLDDSDVTKDKEVVDQQLDKIVNSIQNVSKNSSNQVQSIDLSTIKKKFIVVFQRKIDFRQV